jgi:hypothetical protein
VFFQYPVDVLLRRLIPFYDVDRILKKHRAKDAPFLAAALQIIHLAHAVKGFKPPLLKTAHPLPGVFSISCRRSVAQAHSFL